ncbi:MAG: MarR family winged helix-turn-helix transcriptional regulator [Thermodesulfobacteriota bacterium]
MTELADLSHQLIEFYERFSAWEQEVVRGTGLSPAQMHAIEIIGQAGPLRMKELAAKAGVTTGTITVMVDRLSRQGMVRRSPNANDRRSFLIELTEKGQKLYTEHHRFHLRLTEEIASGLKKQEVDQFRILLARVSAHL